MLTSFQVAAQPTHHQGKKDTLRLKKSDLLSLLGSEGSCFPLFSRKGGILKPQEPAKTPQPATTVKGSITYDYQYRSLIDTPVYTKDFSQHTLSVNLAILYKGNYPVNVRFQVRKSNQPLFKDFTDINFRYDPRDFSKVIENRVKAWASRKLEREELQRLQHLADSLRAEKARLGSFVSGPATLQRIVEARERLMLKQKNALPKQPKFADSLQQIASNKQGLKDSLNSLFPQDSDSAILQVYQKDLDSLSKLQARIKRTEDTLRQKKEQFIAAQQKLETALKNRDGNIEALIKASGIPEDSLPKGYKQILSLRRFSAGRRDKICL